MSRWQKYVLIVLPKLVLPQGLTNMSIFISLLFGLFNDKVIKT